MAGSLLKEIEKASRKANMKADAMKEHRQRSGELRDPERSERKSVRAHSNAIPRRGVLDEDGSIFLGFKGDIIEVNGITSAELKTDGTTDERAVTTAAARSAFLAARHFKGGDSGSPNRLPDGVKVHLDNDTDGQFPSTRLLGNIPDANIPNIPFTKITGSIDGGRLRKKSIPSNRLHNVHGSKLTGDESIPWKLIDVQGVVFTHRLEKRLAEERRKSDRKYARKP